MEISAQEETTMRKSETQIKNTDSRNTEETVNEETNDSINKSMKTVQGKEETSEEKTEDKKVNHKKSSSLKRKKIAPSQLSSSSSLDHSVKDSKRTSQTVQFNSKEEIKIIKFKKASTKETVQPKRDVLQQKYQELHQLLVLPLVHSTEANSLKLNQLLHFHGLSQNESFSDPNKDSENHVEVPTGSSEDDTNTSHQPDRFRAFSKTHHDEHQRYAASPEHSTEQGYSQWVRKYRANKSTIKKPNEIIENHNKVKKQMVQPSDTFLKNTTNPYIKQWLRKKERELRKKRQEERKKLKAERLKKQEEEMLRQDKFKDSDLKVREWMLLKRKEAAQKKKETKQLDKDEMANSQDVTEKGSSSPKKSDGVEIQGITQLNITLNHQSNHLPASNFVYARPVSGRVRLIKLQQEQKENAKRKEEEKQLFQKQLEKEKNKRMRVSYDQWLLKKRDEDYARRQEAARMRGLAKSDSELLKINKELSKKRIKKIKTRDDFDTKENEEDKVSGDLNKDGVEITEKIKVLGYKKNLNVRPSSARPSLSPRPSKKKHRPLSAKPTPKSSEENSDSQEKRMFKLPYPPEKGAPKYIIDRQRKLFSPHLTNSSLSKVKSATVISNKHESAKNESVDLKQVQTDHKSQLFQLTVNQDVNNTHENEIRDNVSKNNDIQAEPKDFYAAVKFNDIENKDTIVDVKDREIKIEDTSLKNNNSENQQNGNATKGSVNFIKDEDIKVDCADNTIMHNLAKNHKDEVHQFTDVNNMDIKTNEVIDTNSDESLEWSETDVLNNNFKKGMSTQDDNHPLALLEQIVNSESSEIFPNNNALLQTSENQVIFNYSNGDFRHHHTTKAEDSTIQSVSAEKELILAEPVKNTELSTPQTSTKHVSFQESPVVFEELSVSDSSSESEVEEDLPEENDDF